MSANLIGGFHNRLEGSRKYLFGSAGVYGENNNSKIVGAYLARGAGTFEFPTPGKTTGADLPFAQTPSRSSTSPRTGSRTSTPPSTSRPTATLSSAAGRGPTRSRASSTPTARSSSDLLLHASHPPFSFRFRAPHIYNRSLTIEPYTWEDNSSARAKCFLVLWAIISLPVPPGWMSSSIRARVWWTEQTGDEAESTWEGQRYAPLSPHRPVCHLPFRTARLDLCSRLSTALRPPRVS